MSNREPRPDADERLRAAIAELRQRAGLTQAELAERAGMPEQEVTDLEAGHYEPTWGDLRHIAYALGVPLPELLARVEAD